MKVSGTLGPVSWGHWNPIRGGQEGGGIRQSQEDPPPNSPTSPQLTRQGEGCSGACSGNRTVCRVSGQTMSRLSQAAVPGAGARLRVFPLLLPLAHQLPPAPAQVRAHPTPHVPEAQPSGAGERFLVVLPGNPRLGPFSGRYFSQEATGDWDSLGGFFSYGP